MQLSFELDTNLPDEVIEAIRELGSEGSQEERGAVLTSRPVVDAILDLVGYKPDLELASFRLLEPSFGNGDFLFSVIDRLLESYFAFGGTKANALENLKGAIVSVEIHLESFLMTKRRVQEQLVDSGISSNDAIALADSWLVHDDFLLTPVVGSFDFVVGNPPYVRQERIPKPLLKEYRQRFDTMYDRADLYIPFYERGLDLLGEKGVLGFICANRWIKNKYGKKLRKKVTDGFHLEYYIDAKNLDAFDQEVLAYPAITVISRNRKRATRIAVDSVLGTRELIPRIQNFSSDQIDECDGIGEIDRLPKGSNPWLLDSPKTLTILRQLETRFPKLEEDGCRVSIGVATGCDRVFIGDYEDLPVEDDRKLRLVKAPDIRNGRIEWGAKGIINPFMEDGSLAQLEDYPRFAAYLQEHEEAIRGRHVAKKQPEKWYRTIDRIYPALVGTQKLLIPDIKGDATVVLDAGHFYPHHNLYVVTSESWELRALQAVLRSSVALMFVAAYCSRMAGGFLRFQAQYLRRIRIPSWESLDSEEREALVEVSQVEDQERIDRVVLPLFGLTPVQQIEVRKFAKAARA